MEKIAFYSLDIYVEVNFFFVLLITASYIQLQGKVVAEKEVTSRQLYHLAGRLIPSLAEHDTVYV